MPGLRESLWPQRRFQNNQAMRFQRLGRGSKAEKKEESRMSLGLGRRTELWGDAYLPCARGTHASRVGQ